MRRTKKEFIKCFNLLYFTVEFHHGERGLFYSGCGMEQAIETATICSMRGGICFTFPEKYKSSIWQLIDQRERETKRRIDLDYFKANIAAYIKDIDESERK